MVWDTVLELLAYLGIRALKKKKKEDTDSTSAETSGPNLGNDVSGRTSEGGIPVCAGCSRTVEKGAIFEIGKTWCVDCYKSHVLKVRE
jgi:hypothetical protein